MSFKRLLFFFLLLTFLLAACRPGEAMPAAKAPEKDKTTVVGKVVSLSTGKPLANTIVRLAEVYETENEKGAYVLDVGFSPGDITDENGDFVIENIDPKKYVVVIGDVYDVYSIIKNDQGTAKVWETEVGKVVKFGVIRVELGK